MDIRPRGPIEYPLGTLTPDHFEILTFLLAHAEDPAVVPVRNKDRGLDARLEDGRGRTLHGWQAKRFGAGDIHWDQCRASVRSAIAFWRPPHITFTFPNDLSAKEQVAFADELAALFPVTRLDYWSGSEMQRRIRDTDEGRRAAHWLFENPGADLEALHRALATGGELASTMQAAERQAVIQRFVDRDPHVHYTMVSRSRGAPYTAPARETFLSVTIEIDGQEIRLDAAERYPGALMDLGGPPAVHVSPDDAGRDAAQVVRRVAEGGGAATIESGIGVAMPVVPVGLRGLMPDDVLWGPVSVSRDPAIVSEQRLLRGGAALVAAGDVELGVTLQATDSPIGDFDATYVGAAGGIELFLSIRRDLATGGTAAARVDWRHTLGIGTALEQLLAAQITLAALRGDPIELLYPPDRRVLGAGRGAAGKTGDPAGLEDHIRFLELVVELEAWLGAPLDPPARPSQADAEELGRLIGLVRIPERQDTWTLVRTVTPGGSADYGPDPVEVAILEPIYAELFEQRIYAGLHVIRLHSAMVERLGDEEVVLRPADEDAQCTTTLQHPSLSPADAAKAPSGLPGSRVLIRPVAKAETR